MNLNKILKTHFGYDQFRPLQEEIINNILAGKDTFVLMPTGGGKSLCYQLPSFVFSGITLVISPLIALMKDQVDGLKENGILAGFINSSLSSEEINHAMAELKSGNTRILYIAPERLAMPSFQSFLTSLDISLIAIDEAHCISEWGHDFRPDYRNLKMLKSIFPGVPTVALTATATEMVRDDIVNQLSFTDSGKFVSSFNRDNLNLLVTRKKRAFNKLGTLLDKHHNESVIIYCFSRKETETIVEKLLDAGYNARCYHAGLDVLTRKENQELFIKDEVNIIVATIAFGMGIDKPDIRLVVHYSLPKSIEGYYQEIGRAGRDGLESDCVLFYSYGDKIKHEYFLNQITDKSEYAKVEEKLSQVIDYCEYTMCRRKYILEYFGEEYKTSVDSGDNKCGACDICMGTNEQIDATIISQKIMSSIIRTGSRFGAKHVSSVLLGLNSKQIINNNHDQLSVFGIVTDYDMDGIYFVIKSLVNLGLIAKAGGTFPILQVTEKGLEWLKSRKTLTLSRPDELVVEEKRSKKQIDVDYDTTLFEQLRKLRKKLADEKEVPPFVIFSDVSLREMAIYYPLNSENFLAISGVGEKKLAVFGEMFLDIINTYVVDNDITITEVKVVESKKSRKKSSPKSKFGNSRYKTTMEMVQSQTPISTIAQMQGFTETTIINHIFKLLSSGKELDIDYIKPDDDVIKNVGNALIECGSEALKPVYEHLDEKYSYEEIRLVKLFLI